MRGIYVCVSHLVTGRHCILPPAPVSDICFTNNYFQLKLAQKFIAHNFKMQLANTCKRMRDRNKSPFSGQSNHQVIKKIHCDQTAMWTMTAYLAYDRSEVSTNTQMFDGNLTRSLSRIERWKEKVYKQAWSARWSNSIQSHLAELSVRFLCLFPLPSLGLKRDG